MAPPKHPQPNLAMRVLLFYLYSNLFIATCAAMMSWETMHFFGTTTQGSADWHADGVVRVIFGATLFAYGLHWLAGLRSPHQAYRYHWTRQHRFNLAAMALAGLALLWGWIPEIARAWRIILPAALVTALYTLPKIERFRGLRMIAAGKTFLLAASWTYVTAIMPMLLTESTLTPSWMAYVAGRFFLLYAICLLFDHRDVEQDRAEGLVTLPSRLTPRQLAIVFYTSLLFSACSTVYPCVFLGDCQLPVLIIRLSPLALLLFLFPPAIHRFRTASVAPLRQEAAPGQLRSDIFYYGLLDFLMMLPAALSFGMAF
jgi:4-hydroxybenzoate polyprenyltransferase